MERSCPRETTRGYVTDPPPARRTFVYSSHRFLSKLCLYAHIAYVRVSSLSSVEVLWCVAPMEDSHGDPSQDSTLDPDSLSQQHTTRLPAGRGDSSHFTHLLDRQSSAQLWMCDRSRNSSLLASSALDSSILLTSSWVQRVQQPRERGLGIRLVAPRECDARFVRVGCACAAMRRVGLLPSPEKLVSCKVKEGPDYCPPLVDAKDLLPVIMF